MAIYPESIVQIGVGGNVQWAPAYTQLTPHFNPTTFVQYGEMPVIVEGEETGRIWDQWKCQVENQTIVQATKFKTRVVAFLLFAVIISVVQIILLHYIQKGVLPHSSVRIMNLVVSGVVLIGMGSLIFKLYKIYSSGVDHIAGPIDDVFANKVIDGYERAPDNDSPLPNNLRETALALTRAAYLAYANHADINEAKLYRTILKIGLIVVTLFVLVGLAVGLYLNIKYNLHLAINPKAVFVSAIISTVVATLLLVPVTWKLLTWVIQKEREALAAIAAPLPPALHKLPT